MDGSSQINGVAPSTSSNADLTWETTYQTNFGLDYSLLEDRIYGSIDVYNSTTQDLLFVTVPAASGLDVALTNIGEVRTKVLNFL